MSDGYGHDFSFWDKLVQEKFKDQLEKLGKHKYENLCVFKSPKGRWMAFHNTTYTDIRVVDLETLEVVVETFYSKRVFDKEGNYDREKSVYGEHTNFSTFVPVYQIVDTGKTYGKHDKKLIMEYDMAGLDESDLKWLDWDKLFSPPIAFNAWTIWACDFEFYVDTLDLSQVDEGIIKVYKGGNFIIPRGASNVRNYVEFELTYFFEMKPSETERGVYVNAGTTTADRGEYHIGFKYLEEKSLGQFNYNINTKEGGFHKDSEVKVKDLPWEEYKERLDNYKAGKAKNNE